MKIAVVGSRTFDDYERVKEILTPRIPFVLVSGGARGADTLADKFARENGLATMIYPARWEKYGKRAAYIRNKKIVEEADLVIAFWDGKSRGTEMTINLADQMGKQVVMELF